MNGIELIETVIEQLTGEKPEMRVDEDEMGAVVHATVTGRVSTLIGRQGITIESLRVLARALGYNGKHRIKLVTHERS